MEHVTKDSENKFHARLRNLMNRYVHSVYDFTPHFPKHEMFGVTSQFRRAALSVILNYIEGYARFRKNVYKNFLEISYGSLQESKYLSEFSFQRKYLNEKEYKLLAELEREVGAMLWGTLSRFE